MRGQLKYLGVAVMCVGVLNGVAAAGATTARTASPAAASGTRRRMHAMPQHANHTTFGAPAAATAAQPVATAASGSGKLTWHGGAVLHGTTTYAVFWQPLGTYMSPAYKTDIASYLSSVGGTAMYSVLGQYYDIPGAIDNVSTYGGAWTDTSSFAGRGSPSAPLSDADMVNEVRAAAAANASWVQPGAHAVYFVFLPRGVYQRYDSANESFVQYCAYHSYYTDPQTSVDGYYAVMPYAGTDLAGCGIVPFGHPTPNNDADADAEINTVSHEQFEAVTDPHLDAWYDAAGYEIADKCGFSLGPVGADGGDVTLNGQRYALQGEFSNADNNCVVNLPTKLAAVPAKTKPAAGTQFNLYAYARDTSGRNEYGFASTVTITSSDPHMQITSASHTFSLADRGGWAFFVTLWTAGTQTVTATDATDGLSTTATVTVSASGVVNGGFESGLASWAHTGSESTAAGAHGGAIAMRAGSTTASTIATSTLAQTFIAPYGVSHLDIWYLQSCPDVVTHDWVTITNRDISTAATTVVLPHTCNKTGAWTLVSTPVQPGHKYRVTLTNHDDKRPALATYTAFDDISTS